MGDYNDDDLDDNDGGDDDNDIEYNGCHGDEDNTYVMRTTRISGGSTPSG